MILGFLDSFISVSSATYLSLKLILFYFLVIYGLLACENGAYIEKDDALRIITDWESGHVPDAITHSLFNEVCIHLENLTGLWVNSVSEFR